jgi:hypothetical protein
MSDAQISYAQSNSCSAAQSTIRSLERNRDFRALSKNINAIKKLQTSLNKLEREFVRGGCQKQLNAKKKLSGQCRTLARNIIRGRSNFKSLQGKISAGRAIASKRKNLLQQVKSKSCSTPRANTNKNQTLLDVLFGNKKSQVIIETPKKDIPNIKINLNTLRTVCVRLSDGYYWPISFSTTKSYLRKDEARCHAQANGDLVDLYYHRTPAEDVGKMRNISGKSYKSLENAFRYRQEFEPSNTFKRKATSGFIEVVNSQAGNASFTIIKFADQNFPLPIKDPRQKTKTTIIAATYVPLPLNRPYRDGEEKPQVIIAAPKINVPIMTFVSNGKTIRIIGPDTLYAQSEATDS